MSILDIEPIRRVRQNHAMEHATIHILTRQNPGLRLVARSTSKGFQVYGPVDTKTLASAASEALSRLQNGERELAVHPRCGTGVAVAGVLSGLAAFAAMQADRRRRMSALPSVLLASTFAVLISQPLGLIVQRDVTTDPNLEGVRIGEIARHETEQMVVHQVTLEHD